MDRYPPATEYQPAAETANLADAALAAWTLIDVEFNVRLLDADFAFTPNMSWADLQEATYDGYARKIILLSTVTLEQEEGSGDIRKQSTVLASFLGPTIGGPVTLYGWAATEGIVGTPARLYRVYKFSQPVVLNGPADVLNIIPVFSFKTGNQG